MDSVGRSVVLKEVMGVVFSAGLAGCILCGRPQPLSPEPVQATPVIVPVFPENKAVFTPVSESASSPTIGRLSVQKDEVMPIIAAPAVVPTKTQERLEKKESSDNASETFSAAAAMTTASATFSCEKTFLQASPAVFYFAEVAKIEVKEPTSATLKSATSVSTVSPTNTSQIQPTFEVILTEDVIKRLPPPKFPEEVKDLRENPPKPTPIIIVTKARTAQP